MDEARPKRAIVTGAASGIGLATARRLLSQRVDVVAVDLNAEALRGIGDAGARTVAADLTDPSARARLVADVGEVDYLVNAAGIIRLAPLFEVDQQTWRDIFAINAEAVFFLCQALGPRLRSGGAIVNLSSTSAKLATTLEVAVYAASKATVLSITRSFAYALAGRPVRVNAVCPGIIDTPMQDAVVRGIAQARGMTEEAIATTRVQAAPLGRSGTPEECAAVIHFLLSDEAAYMTGQAINISGGLVTW